LVVIAIAASLGVFDMGGGLLTELGAADSDDARAGGRTRYDVRRFSL
jgi:hypothetical protein